MMKTPETNWIEQRFSACCFFLGGELDTLVCGENPYQLQVHVEVIEHMQSEQIYLRQIHTPTVDASFCFTVELGRLKAVTVDGFPDFSPGYVPFGSVGTWYIARDFSQDIVAAKVQKRSML